jgi:hypothetical protein
MRQIYITISVFLVLILASQANAGINTYWNPVTKDNCWNLDQTIWLEQKAPTTFWAEYWLWTNMTTGNLADTGAYVGIQTNGTFYNGLPPGELAIFSVWNASGARGYNCGKFSGEGNGYSCRIPLPIYVNTLYRLRIWGIDSDSIGQWWGAWILDGHTGDDKYIGSIRINSSYRLSVPQNFVEYFGPYLSCSQRPVSIIDWVPPALNNGQYHSTYARFNDDCTGNIFPQNYYRGVGQ